MNENKSRCLPVVIAFILVGLVALIVTTIFYIGNRNTIPVTLMPASGKLPSYPCQVGTGTKDDHSFEAYMCMPAKEMGSDCMAEVLWSDGRQDKGILHLGSFARVNGRGRSLRYGWTAVSMSTRRKAHPAKITIGRRSFRCVTVSNEVFLRYYARENQVREQEFRKWF